MARLSIIGSDFPQDLSCFNNTMKKRVELSDIALACRSIKGQVQTMTSVYDASQAVLKQKYLIYILTFFIMLYYFRMISF